MIQIGNKLPSFNLPRDGGTTVSSDDHSGKRLVLFFYPRDSTPGCTTESIEFTEFLPDFQTLNTVVLGVSKDDVKSHNKFVAKHDLGMPRLSDAEDDLCELLGVWTEKSMYGKKIMGIERSTFVTDMQSQITHIWRKVKVKGHVAQVLDSVRSTT